MNQFQGDLSEFRTHHINHQPRITSVAEMRRWRSNLPKDCQCLAPLTFKKSNQCAEHGSFQSVLVIGWFWIVARVEMFLLKRVWRTGRAIQAWLIWT